MISPWLIDTAEELLSDGSLRPDPGTATDSGTSAMLSHGSYGPFSLMIDVFKLSNLSYDKLLEGTSKARFLTIYFLAKP